MLQSTCIDQFALSIPRFRSDSYSDAITYLLEADVRFSISATGLPALAHIQLENYPLSLPDCDEIVEAILRKCELDLQSVLKGTRLEPSYVGHLCSISTNIGWGRGCEILFASQHNISSDGEASLYAGVPLLQLAARSCDLPTLEFWLKAREIVKDKQLTQIGTPEHLLWVFFDYDLDPIWLPTVLDALVRQRQQLQALLEVHGIEGQCLGHGDRLLDAHAWCAIDRLEAARVHVPGYLRPSRRSIYYSLNEVRDRQTLDKFYEAGFRDVAASDFACDGHHGETPIAPLLHAIIRGRWFRSFGGNIQTFNWFLSKGANALECWPNTTVTAVHFLGYEASWDKSPSPQCVAERVELLLRSDSDGCVCPCSTSGCLPVTCCIKGLWSLRREWNWPSSHAEWLAARNRVILWLSTTVRQGGCRELITAFIRIFIFEELELQHTCCDIERTLQATIYMILDGSISPTPRYPPAALRRIQQEDAYLVTFLEELVPAFDNAYDAFDGDLAAFVADYMDPELKQKKKELAKQDEEKYGQGRRELGVAMEVLSDDEEDEEESEDAESEFESDETSDQEESGNAGNGAARATGSKTSRYHDC